MTNRVALGFTILASLGALTAIVFQVIAGVQYRIDEERGVQPGYSPAWLVAGTEVGMWVFAFALVALAATAVLSLVRRQRLKAR
ncbi:MAG: hypothetical protein ABJA94_03640 [Rhodoglobus sp.]